MFGLWFAVWSNRYGLTFVDPKTLHVTIDWLGKTTEVRPVIDQLSRVRHTTFSLPLLGFGSFPEDRAKPPFILWAGFPLMARNELRLLKLDCGIALGRTQETYRPHVTLCKPSKDQQEQVRAFLYQERIELNRWTVRSFGLYESLGAGNYQLLETFHLSEQLRLF